MAAMDDIKPVDLFGTCDLDGSGYIDRDELAAVCDLDPTLLGEVFSKLDADHDGRISIEEFSENFSKFKSVVFGLKNGTRERSSTLDGKEEYADFSERLGKAYDLLSGQEYVSELFQHLHKSAESPQLLALLESFLFSVVRDVKHYSSENQRMEEALKRTCEKHNEHMEHMDDELQQQMAGLEARIRQEEKSKYERANLDVVWQLEVKNKEIQQLQTEVQKFKGRLKNKEPQEQKLKEELDERTQEIRYLRSQLTDAQTNHAILRSELAQMRNSYEEQTELLNSEKSTVMECIQEQESLTRQLQLLHEANKKLHDTNDDLRSALEGRKCGDSRSPSPNKRHSISSLYPTTKKKKASDTMSDRMSPSSTLSRSMTSTPHPGSRRGSLLPSQQSCEVDGEDMLNESSLMTELLQVKQHTRHNDGEDDEAYGTMPPSERESFKSRLDVLEETNRRLSERNDDLRLALETISGRKMPSKGRKSDKSRRNPSFHSDYGSVSSRSITPNHLQGPKSEEDVADGAEADDLSGYDVGSEGNTMTTSAHHFEGPPELNKLEATPHGPLRITEHEQARNDVEWESEPENNTAEQEEQTSTDLEGKPVTSDVSPFDRNSNLRKPCRQKSLEKLAGDSRGKGDRSTWPEIARAGKWNSMEHVRRKHESFGGERSKSLPTSRWQSADRLNSSSDDSASGLWQLTERLNSLRSSRSTLDDSTELANEQQPAHLMENPRTEAHSGGSSSLSTLTPTSSTSPTQGGDGNRSDSPLPSDDEVKGAPRSLGKKSDETPLENILNLAKTDSLPGSDTSRRESLPNYAELEAQFKSVIEEDPDDIDEDDVRDEELAKLVAMASGNSDSETETDTDTPEGERLAAVGSDSSCDASATMPLNSAVSQNVPERMYKLVLAGDAAVGKSSFILRLCRNRFHSALNSTLGVDFQMKTLSVDGKTIALQLWDTAGQERFRSIAKSYFRKADGVLLLYDVTYETSFINVRDWVEAIEESSSKSIPIMLCGNKVDLRQSQVAEGKAVISEESGRKLAKEYGALFTETSAKDNTNVAEACMQLARLLCTLEDQEVEQSSGLKLTDAHSKGKARPNCCPA